MTVADDFGVAVIEPWIRFTYGLVRSLRLRYMLWPESLSIGIFDSTRYKACPDTSYEEAQSNRIQPMTLVSFGYFNGIGFRRTVGGA